MRLDINISLTILKNKYWLLLDHIEVDFVKFEDMASQLTAIYFRAC